MKRIALIGCTGSIGRQTADIVRRYPDRFCFSSLACGSAGEELSALCREFHPRTALCAKGEFTPPVGTKRLAVGEEAALFADCDVALIAAGGFAGLRYTLLAAEAGVRIALANKESLVCGGELVLRAVRSCSLVGSEMCIRDRSSFPWTANIPPFFSAFPSAAMLPLPDWCSRQAEALFSTPPPKNSST